MGATEFAATVCYALAVLVAMAFGVAYLSRSRFMPYHSDALQQSWDELDSQFQALLLALMRAVGGGWLAVSLRVYFGAHIDSWAAHERSLAQLVRAQGPYTRVRTRMREHAIG